MLLHVGREIECGSGLLDPAGQYAMWQERRQLDMPSAAVDNHQSYGH